MFCLPNFFSFFFLVIALINAFMALKELEKTREILEKTHRAFFELHRCVRQQVTYHNQKDAIDYLLPFLQKGEKERLLQLRKTLVGLNKPELCVHKDLPRFLAKPHKQKNSGLDPLWPNWVPAFYSLAERL
jgi:hypothetical protein